MDTEDGQAFIKNLAYFVRTHEKALANALQLQRESSKHGSTTGGAASPTTSQTVTSSSSSSNTFAAALSLPYLNFTSHTLKPAKLTLTPHHLFYLLSRFEELGIHVGHMNVRLENIHSDTSPTNYVSFLSQAQRRKNRSSDRDSIHSVSSIRSVMSGMTTLWSNLGLTSSASKTEKQKAIIQEELKYLYSAFTKVPCLRLAPDHKARLIAGYEEFPFDTAVPLFAFKNLSALEIYDVDFRQFYGWDRLAEQLRSLTVKRANVDDLADLLVNIVLDDMDRRRRRSAKVSSSPTPPMAASSSKPKQVDITKSSSVPDSPASGTGHESGSPKSVPMARSGSDETKNGSRARPRSNSPSRPTSARHHASYSHGSRSAMTQGVRRSSGSSTSSVRSATPRNSSSNLLSLGYVPSTKWRFLRHLSLADNGLTAITAAALSPLTNTLQSLDLSSNLFTEIPDTLSNLISLRALNMSNCMIESLHSLTRNPLPAITTLNLRANRMVSLAGIERLLSLERLDLRDNKLRDPTELARLTCIPNLREIYVNRNSFTRTHSNYRVTIFNLFRKTPGYTEDVTIDSTGPTYSERKQLVDRVPEAPNVPVVKPPPEEDVFVSPPAQSAPSPPAKETRNSKRVDEEVQPPRIVSLPNPRSRSDYAVTSQRRRKGAKHRVVEFSSPSHARSPASTPVANAPPKSPPSAVAAGPPPPIVGAHATSVDSTYGSSPDATPTRKPAQAALPGGGVPPASPPQLTKNNQEREALPHIDTAAISPLRADSSELHVGVNGELYKKKIEALRNDFGNGWLTALGDDTWDGAGGGGGGHHQDLNALRPAVPPRTTSQTIVSGGRTLG
ncbi:hypothetical protein BDY21DRAFT_278651 [Lineolata rhizophorae]|uniref:Leucine rich repeat domain-containing protein n=1 Tax=Lineolata rhizophorae TaxID=578093 RepID=A0A6A6PCD8_9PEZI|nr:hypothetical protein BDY21DRAFT_278651 [Lineolata rhizophorae]